MEKSVEPWNLAHSPRCHHDVTPSQPCVEPDVDVMRADDEFERSYRAEFVRATRLAHLLTGSNDAAEDIAQEALIRVRARLATIDNPSAYLTTTVVNLSRNQHRTRSRRADRELRVVSATSTVADDGPDRGSEHDDLLELVDRLPFRQRAVLVARYWLDMTEADIAEVLGCRAGTVKSLASRALQTLRKDLP